MEEEEEARKMQEKEDKILLELIKGEITTYTTTPYTFYAFVEGLDIDNSNLGFFVKTDDKYELRSITTKDSFKVINGKTSVTVNVQLSGYENSLIIKALNNNILLTPKNNYNEKIIELKPGKDNFTSIDTLLVLQF